MGNARYGFLPWMRQGIANRISKVDDPDDTSSTGRIQMPVTIKYSKNDTPVNSNPQISKNIQLVYPGDITGINSSVVVRCEPANGVFDFEANYLPYIEFYEEDFLWRYTPASPDGQKLRPWLALVVLKDNEFEFVPPAKEDLPASIEIVGNLSDIFYPHDQHWAWGHVHVFKPRESIGTTATATDKNNFIADLSADRDIAVSRLMSPRRLEKKTQYTAFLIPAFESGRKAGLGIADDPQNMTKTLESSWKNTNNTRFPIYYQWRFGTSELGDFETLVRALKPRVTPAELGGREMDISKSGMGLDVLFEGSTPVVSNTTVIMEGALKPPAFSSGTIMDVQTGDEYSEGIKELVNLSEYMQSGNFLPPNPPKTNPIVTSTNLQLDPVIVPPLYGQWHANVNSIDASSPEWIQEVNLDVRYRAAAGIGAQVVRDNQEKYMEIAWRQIGDVLAVNDKIKKAQLAIEASKNIYAKHLVGDANSTSTTTAKNFDKVARIANASFRKIPAVNPAYSSNQSLSPVLSIKKIMGLTKLTETPINSGFTKVTRNRSTLVKHANATPNSSGNIKNLLYNQLETNANVTACKPFKQPQNVRTLNASDTDYISASLGSTAYSMVLNFPSTHWQYIYNNQAREFYRTQWYYDQLENDYSKSSINIISTGFISPGTTTSLDFTSYVLEMLEPDQAITKRVSELIHLQEKGNVSKLNSLNPIMAYPVLDRPMYDELLKLSNDYILPNASQYPNNSITILQTNRRFIEAYFAGLNHEFSRELLWREYPTDQRGSYFRKFWDTNDTIDLTDLNSSSSTFDPDYLFDINPLHVWHNNNRRLGENHYVSRHGASSPQMVLLIRGDLLKKYPNALIYLQKANDTRTNGKRTLKTITWTNNKPDTLTVKFPLFKAAVQPDITLLGFDISKEAALGDAVNGQEGWFVVFRERPGQIKFGLDEPPYTSLITWDDINWGHLGTNPKYIDVTATLSPTTPQTNPNISWGTDSASMAWITYQKPVIIAVHADDMLV